MADIESVGKYEIRREIGRGAMGIVYEAFDPSIKRVVALKTIRSDQLTGEDSAAAIARFRREAQAAGRLNHPNIVSIYDFGEEEGTWYIAMEYVQGRELKEAFDANERFRVPDVVRIMGQILAALEYSHRQGVVHRDVKPANIFLLPDGTVKVGDFGIAHIEASNLTQVGTVMGTPSYMSPEQIQGLPVDGRSDLFSAGVILYQFLTGERPFAGSASTTMQKVLKEDPLPPSTLNVQLAPAMDAVVRKSLAKRADDRYASAREMADAIAQAAGPQPAIAGRSSEATVIATGDAAATIVAAPAPAKAANSGPAGAPAAAPAYASGARPSSTPAIVVVVIAAVVAIGTVGWFVLQRSGGEGKPTQASVPAATVAQAPVTTPPAPVPTSAASAPASSALPAPAAGAPALPAPAAPPKPDPGTLVITAVGLVDPADPRYQGNPALAQADVRADARSQLVEKAVGMMVDEGSLAKHYDLVRDRVLAQSGTFVRTVAREGEPVVGKDGLLSMTAVGVVDVKAVQKSLNRMSRDERVVLIRAAGNPKVAVRVTVRDADASNAVPQPSPVAENILKERIRSFGFRTWTEGEAPEASEAPDFVVVGEAAYRRLSMRLEASGVTVTKYALTSWTVKSVDRATGEEIYYDTTLPKDVGSFASLELALRAIGTRMGNEFSREFFLEHANVPVQRITLTIDGLPDTAVGDAVVRELAALPGVLAATSRAAATPRVYDVQVAGSGAPVDVVLARIAKPLDAKLGQPCFLPGAASADDVRLVFDAKCADPGVLSRFETNPPAALYRAPPARQKSVTRNPETLRKLAG